MNKDHHPAANTTTSHARMTDKHQHLAAFTTNLPPTSGFRAVQTARIPCSKMGRDFFVKVDIAATPKVDSVALMGLDFSMRPENVRYEVSKGFLTPAPEDFSMHKIKSLAILLYEQERFTPL